MTWRAEQADAIEFVRSLPDASIDAIVTDPPYEIGMMGRSWDSSGIAYSVPLWRECLRVLKPGGHLLAFGGSRTAHRMTCAIEDAGFEIRDSIVWMYGQGFPKSLDVSKAIDKAAGAERERIGHTVYAGGHVQESAESIGFGGSDPARDLREITAPATDDAKKWSGWGTALKPAHEPVCVARKPLVGTVASNVLAHGTGAINIDGCRIGQSKQVPRAPQTAPRIKDAPGGFGFTRDAEATGSGRNPNVGRWPANVMFTHAPECGEQCVDGCPVKELDAQSGVLKSGYMKPGQQRIKSQGLGGYGGGFPDESTREGTYGDSGFASRFFYCAKASTRERWEYLTCHCETGTMPAWVNEVQSRRAPMGVTSPPLDTCAEHSAGGCGCSTLLCGSLHTDPSLPDGRSITSTRTSETTGWKTSDSSPPRNTSESMEDACSSMARGSSRAAAAESESPSVPITSISRPVDGHSMGVAAPATFARLWRGSVCGDCGAKIQSEGHATFKPIAVMRWLVRLVTPPGGTVLDPVTGSGTTGIAAVRERYHFVGCDMMTEHMRIVRARIAHHEGAQLALTPRAKDETT